MTINSLNFDAQALREKILDLAMRGKLVKQDPNDEPASVLLEKIKAEKDQLVKEKKIKKTKPLAPITDEEKPFDIPDSWEWVRLGEIIEVTSGSQLRKKDMISDGKYCVYGANGIIGRYNSYNVNEKTLLIGRVGSVGEINQTTDKGWVTDNALVVSNSIFVNNLWLYYALKSAHLEKLASRTSQPVISGSKVKNSIVAIPPLEEQSRIADKVAQLFALLRKVESSNDQYVELQQMLHDKVLDLAMRGKLVEQDPQDEPASKLLEKIKAEKAQLVKEKKIKKTKPLPPITDEEKPFDIPDSWEWVRLGDIIESVRYGFTASASDVGKYGFVRITDIQDGTVDWEKVPRCDVPEDKLADLQLENNDILIARTGGTVGKSFIVNNLPNVSVFASYLIRIRANDNLIPYLKIVLDSPLYWQYISAKKSGTGQPNVNARKLSEMLIPIPSMVEQEKISDKVKSILEKIGE